MKIVYEDFLEELPIIEGTAEELVKLATAVTGAITHREAIVLHDHEPQIAVRLVGDPS